ncbi:class I adenylate-forming enzyme family protein [Streptomyces sp. NPDC051569]|uniref:class I adenylate-forming enzyme family protein n=1 Tax=Streptomyces sp. NPDC051569 TaxID=3365661 RepID=UPI0037A755F8
MSDAEPRTDRSHDAPAKAPDAGSGPPADVVSLLDRAVRRYGSRPAVRDASGRWNWSELSDAGHRVARALTGHGLVPGARVLMVLPAGRAFVAVLFGALRAGATVVPASGSASGFEVDWLLTDARPALVVTDREEIRGAAAAAGVPVVTPSALLDAAPVPSSTAGPGAGRPDPSGAGAPVPRETAILLYTSGSTGRPKGIICPHRAVVFAVRSIAARLRYRSGDIVWSRLPLSFDYGLYQIFLCAFAGAELVLPAAETSAQELALIRESGATVLPVVPTLAGLLARLAARDRRPTGVRLITNTGAALVGGDARRLRSAFPDASLVCMYGMSECKRITVARPDEDLAHPETVGRALPGTRLFVVDGDGVPLPPGEVGEIVSAGPHVMSGYRNAPEESARRFRSAPDGDGPALFTGDHGRLDEAGRLYFTGRADDIFKRRGWRLSTQELETAMLDIPGVEAAVATPPDEDGVLTVWAVTRHSERDVLRALADRLAPAKVPDRCLVRDTLPRTPNGKIDKAALRASVRVS